MPKIARIQMPDGKIAKFEVADDATPEEVVSLAQAELARVAPDNSGVVWGGEIEDPDVPQQAEDTRPTSFLQGVKEGVLKPINNLARAADAGMDAIGIGGAVDAINEFGAEYLGTAPSLEAAEAEQQRISAASPTQGSGFGRAVGGFAATLPTMALPGGVLAQGAASGALLTDARDVEGVALDAGIGAAAGFVGDRAIRGIAGAVSPHVAPRIAALRKEGVRLTPGQIAGQGGIAGRAVKSVEDTLGSMPVVGAGIRGAQQRGVEDLNRAATNRALRPIGETLPANIPVGHDAVAHAGDRLSAAYQDVLPRLSGQMDRGFLTRWNALRARTNLPPEYDNLLDQVHGEVANAFQRNGVGGRYSGRTLRDTSERLQRLAQGWRNNPNDPYVREVGEFAEQVRGQLHALARRQNPRDAERLRNIDRGYASLVRVERAAAGTTDGVFTPFQYKNATRMSDTSRRRRASARGQALDQDLSANAATVLPSTAGQGGSKDVNSLIALGATTGAALTGNPIAAAGLGAVGAGSAAYTPAGQAAIQWLMTGRQNLGAQRTANALRALAPGVGVTFPNALLASEP